MATWTKRELSKLKTDANDLPWDDNQVSLSSARLHPTSTPSWEPNYDWGVSGGVEYPVLAFDIGHKLFFSLQTTHSMLLKSWMDNHIHGTLPSNDAGKKIKWQLDVLAAGIGDAWAVPDGSPYTKEITLQGDEAHKHNMIELSFIPPVNTTVSSIYHFQLTRIAASSDDYGSDVYLIFNDSHFQLSDNGSYFEGGKLTDEMATQKGPSSKPFKPGAW